MSDALLSKFLYIWSPAKLQSQHIYYVEGLGYLDRPNSLLIYEYYTPPGQLFLSSVL